MLSAEKLAQIREELDSCKRPIFFFHDDPDGVCSAVILAKTIKRVTKKDVNCLSYVSNPSLLKEAIEKMRSKKVNKLIFTDISEDQ